VNWAASGTVSEGVGGSVVGTGLLSVVGTVTGEFSGVVSGVIHPAVRIHEMAMNSKKKFILDVMNKGTLIPINRYPPGNLSEKRIVIRQTGAVYPCIAGRGFHSVKRGIPLVSVKGILLQMPIYNTALLRKP